MWFIEIFLLDIRLWDMWLFAVLGNDNLARAGIVNLSYFYGINHANNKSEIKRISDQSHGQSREKSHCGKPKLGFCLENVCGLTYIHG